MPLIKDKSKEAGIKNVTYLDIQRASNKEEAYSLLSDEKATEELIKHLEGRYGVVKDISYINYDPIDIIRRFSTIRS